jgi:hypothetical protein
MMPHDKNGELLKVGDKVIVECEVTDVQGHPEFCNMSVKTVEPMFPGNSPTTITLNCKQVVKAVVAALVLLASAAFGSAAEPPRAKAPPRVKGFRATCPCAAACVCPAGVCPACPAAAAIPAAPQLVQVCENGVCRLVPATGGVSPPVAPQFAAPARQRWYPGKLLGR